MIPSPDNPASRPGWRIALTAGEPAGVGPELLVRIAQRAWPVRLVAIGDGDCLRERARMLGLPLQLLPDTDDARDPLPAGSLALREVRLAQAARPGHLDPRNAAAVLATLALAAEGALSSRFDAIVTAPVQKSVLDQAGQPFSGHTEFFQRHARVARVLMLLCTALPQGGSLRVALATTHLPLREVADAIDAAGVEACLRLLHAALRRDWGIEQPRIAVLGLNPHAGESGHLGKEEQRVLQPLLERLRSEGMQLDGPLPADTAFTPSQLQRSDAYLAMYHDQGLPVLKYAGFGRAVNLTLGLPYVRSSVDHGTALDIAASLCADSGSLEAAIDEALHMLKAGR